MNDSIEVWRPKIAIPVPLKSEIAKVAKPISDPECGRLRDDAGVDVMTIGGMESLYCDGICDWHDDKHITNKYSLLLVVRNETDSYVQSKRVAAVKEQPVGTMVFLNIWKKHRLWHPKGVKSPLGVFLAFCVDLNEKPTCMHDCEVIMRKRIKNRLTFAKCV